MNVQQNINRLFIEKGPILRTALLRENGITSKDIAVFLASGEIKKLKTGYYMLADMESQLSDTELAARVIPQGVVCLFSAAQHYALTTVNPLSVNIAVPAPGNSLTLPQYPPITLYKWAKNIYPLGVIAQKAPNYTVRIYDQERTVCDFYRLRLQLGEDMALEVLKSYMAGKKNIQKLYEYAKALRIQNVLAPYVEALL